jgi:threonine aldolase
MPRLPPDMTTTRFWSGDGMNGNLRVLRLTGAGAASLAAIADLRSDTVTRPTPAMRRAIAEAEVGDDQYGEDPSVLRLQERVAALLGKEAALLVPTGTMANQLALKLYCRPGDDVVVGVESHAAWHETGAAAAVAGVQLTAIGSDGRFTADELVAALRPRGHLLYPPTTLVEVEDTHNRKGGRVWDRAELERVGAAAREHGVASYLDGARLLNAAVARGDHPATLAAPFDLVSIALSKGLGCPVGSVVAGSRSDIAALERYRRMLGGAMRQSGVLAAAGIHALDHHVERLAEDHVNAMLIGRRLFSCPGVQLDIEALETNIVVFGLREGAPDAATVVARAAERGVLVMAFGPRTVRAVTHLDVSRADCERAADVLAEAVA